MLDPSLIYGKAHTLFFIFSGLTTLLVWTSIILLDDFWKKTYISDATKFYPFVVNGGGLFALIFYDQINKFFSFKTQLRYFPFGLALSFVILFIVGEYVHGGNGTRGDAGSNWNLKSGFFVFVLVVQGSFNAVLQVKILIFIEFFFGF